MAKKCISGADLSWLISEELFEAKGDRSRTALAVVPDEKHGWRVVIANRGRTYWTAASEKQLADIQRRLRKVYDLQS
jgi:hypothetical protein